jgi:glutathione S-transferase
VQITAVPLAGPPCDERRQPAASGVLTGFEHGNPSRRILHASRNPEDFRMKLYYSPGACSLSPLIALHEAGIAFEPVLASTKTHKLQDGTDYYTLNPKGYVPLLELDNGERLTEGPAIVQYIADQAPAKNLAPANGTMARYRLQEWLNFITSEIHKGFSPLFNPAVPEEFKVMQRNKLVERFTWVDGELKGKSYLMGDTFSVADGYLYTVANWCQFVGVDIAALANLAAYMQRVAARPAVQQARRTEGTLK